MKLRVRLGLAGHEIDVVIIQGGTCKHSPVGMESSAGDRGRAVVMEEAWVWLECGQVGAIHIEGLDFMAVCAPGIWVSSNDPSTAEGNEYDLHAENRGMFMHTQGS